MAEEALLRSELGRAFEAYFGVRGGVVPGVPAELVPVIILDDQSAGPYPAHRVWHGALNQAASAGNFSTCTIQNEDAQGNKSAVVIDRIFVRVTVANDVIVTVGRVAVEGGGPGAYVQDAAAEKDQQPSLAPQNGTVAFRSSIPAAAYPGTIFPVGTLASVEIPGPFILGPQELLSLQPNAVNVGIFVWARGRHYSAP
jgi:hypothetical protein